MSMNYLNYIKYHIIRVSYWYKKLFIFFINYLVWFQFKIGRVVFNGDKIYGENG